ncbi:hypothetical protein BJ875DRAFT_440057 [Amylocarpus encephaloides]|uniref:Glucose-methanol-choline oxidoreductase N-terminal domain-containing protein n=1 Tax=Amylocarpus encephaloides TaxID=45428 RepID=A0A9P7YLH5_9HELO|nr:hypothetical protein BJ875DRAFT_440057 [Amylocarpus encephaloides]
MKHSVAFFAVQTIPALIVTATPASVFSAQHLTRATDVAHSYDCLIIGGGISGLTVADRLTEDPKHTVLVIEYGYFGNLEDIGTVYPPTGLRKSSPAHLYNITAVGKYPAKVFSPPDSNLVKQLVGVPLPVKAKKEIILAAGAIHSPQALQRSGVGPKTLLEAVKIPVVVSLPGVGQNFQDHTSLNVGYNFTTNAWPNPNTLKTNETYRLEVDALWNSRKIGITSPEISLKYPLMLTTTLELDRSILHARAHEQLCIPPLPRISPNKSEELATAYKNQDPAAYLPIGTDKSIIAGYKAQLKLLAAGIRSKDTAWMQMASSPIGSTAVTNLHPLSRGTINLNVSDPAGEPIVDFRATSNPMDTRLFVELIRLARRYLATQGVMKELSPVFFNPPLNVSSDEDLGAWVESVLLPTVYHPIGTCAMMPRELGGVVHDELLVYGVERVRVVDASVMPMLIGANTSQTVYAVAEKAADLIRGLLKKKGRS